jgi:hypothetical protein
MVDPIILREDAQVYWHFPLRWLTPWHYQPLAE